MFRINIESSILSSLIADMLLLGVKLHQFIIVFLFAKSFYYTVCCVIIAACCAQFFFFFSSVLTVQPHCNQVERVSGNCFIIFVNVGY